MKKSSSSRHGCCSHDHSDLYWIHFVIGTIEGSRYGSDSASLESSLTDPRAHGTVSIW
jgi:hypothetical protein